MERLRRIEFEALLAKGYQVMAKVLEEAAGEAAVAQAAASEAWSWDCLALDASVAHLPDSRLDDG